MQIYWIKAQAPRRVLALVKHLGIKAECIEMDMMAGALKTSKYVALNPNMKAPTLVDGELVLWESSAIIPVGHVADQRSDGTDRDTSLAILERLPLGTGRRAVLFRAYHQADVRHRQS